MEEGQCCKPDTVDAYCSYMGTCDSTGSYCVCVNSHFWASERCLVWHEDPDPHPEPSECPDLPMYPPSSSPTVVGATLCPTVLKVTTASPTLAPTFITTACNPGSRAYCHHRGTCSAAGDVCICDDKTHYWPSERCEVKHPGPELEEGQCCKPNMKDAYCSYLGTCDPTGSYCNCTEHFWAAERCEHWHEEVDPNPIPESCPEDPVFPPTSAPSSVPTVTYEPTAVPSIVSTSSTPTVLTGPCNPGSTSYCNHRGYCSEEGDGCVCFDPIHYWPSEQCSTKHSKPELKEGHCCKPNSRDEYCSYKGVCHSSGQYCECDSSEFWASEGCSTYHAPPTQDPNPDTCPGTTSSPSASPSGAPSSRPSLPPSGAPSSAPSRVPSGAPTRVPSSLPTAAPSFSPSSLPSHPPSRPPTSSPSSAPSSAPTSCLPGDRLPCSNLGACSADSTGCDCDDPLHYWPSEHCAVFHEGPELLPGQFCSPGERDYYCSWLGKCDESGAACECDDPAHRSSSDRCSSWSPQPTDSPSDQLCETGDRGVCHNRGTCDSSTGENVCTCDDPLHYWSSERCEVKHLGGEVPEASCCVPHQRDYYCSWLGECDASGRVCQCDDPLHYWSSERCQSWHPGEDPSPPSATDSCPDLLFEESLSSESSAGVLGMPSTVFYCVVFVVVGVAVLAVLVARRHYSSSLEDDHPRDSQFTYDDAIKSNKSIIEMKSPYQEGGAAAALGKALKRGSSLMSSGFDYENVGDEGDGSLFMQESPYVTAQKEEEEVLSKPSNFTYDDVTHSDSLFEMQSPYETAREQEEMELAKPSNFSYDDVCRNPSLFSTDNELLVDSKGEEVVVDATGENLELNNSEINI